MPGTFFGPYGENFSDYSTPSGGNAGRFPAGHSLILPDGREFRFTENDGTVEVAGNVYQGAAPIANATNQAVDTARAAGAVVISATLGATAAAIDAYAEGYVFINDAAGEGYAHRIKRAIASGDGHAAADASAVLTVNLEAGEAVQVALTTSSEASFNFNRFRGVIISPAGQSTAALSGVSPGVAAANQWYWSQVRGMAAVLTHGTVLIGDVAVASCTSSPVAGAVAASAAIETDGPVVGTVAHVGATTEYSLIDLKID